MERASSSDSLWRLRRMGTLMGTPSRLHAGPSNPWSQGRRSGLFRAFYLNAAGLAPGHLRSRRTLRATTARAATATESTTENTHDPAKGNPATFMP